MGTLPFEKSCYLFIERLLNPTTGLAVSNEREDGTTVYKNALAIMVLLHEENLTASERILDVFKKYYEANRDNFQGFPQTWNSRTGLPDTKSIHWEGDTAFLLLAVNYYYQTTGSFGGYEDLVQSLVSWLAFRSLSCDLLLAEAVAEMVAALTPFSGERSVHRSLKKLHQCFYSKGRVSSVDYEHNLRHIILGALVFGDTTGFKYLNNFSRQETYNADSSQKITAFSEFANDLSINVEVSVQLLLALKIWRFEVEFEMGQVQTDLEKVLLPGKQHFHASRPPSLAPICYLLFYYWGFNPYAPGKKCATKNSI